MRIPPEKITAWVTNNFEVKERKGGQELRICNPFDGDTGYHFNINIEKGACHDWHGDVWAGRHASGKLKKRTFLKFVQIYLNCSYAKAVAEVLGSSSSARSFLRHQKFQGRQESKEDASLALPEATESLLDPKQAKTASLITKWLLSRGIDKHKIEKYNIMHSGLDVVWPYHEFDSLVYWQSRSRFDKRFLFPSEDIGVSKGEFLYGFDHIEPASYLIITEAIFDCQTLEEQCTALGGAHITDRQVSKIKFLGPRDGIILAPDNDVAGIESLLANAKHLAPLGYKVLFSIPPELEYERDGEAHITKDWNDIATHRRDQNPRQLMEDGILMLNLKQRLRLTGLVAERARR